LIESSSESRELCRAVEEDDESRAAASSPAVLAIRLRWPFVELRTPPLYFPVASRLCGFSKAGL